MLSDGCLGALFLVLVTLSGLGGGGLSSSLASVSVFACDEFYYKNNVTSVLLISKQGKAYRKGVYWVEPETAPFPPSLNIINGSYNNIIWEIFIVWLM